MGLIVLSRTGLLMSKFSKAESAAAQIIHSPQGLWLSKLGVNGVPVQAVLPLISLPSLVGGR